jgi:hypothetical protein
MFVYDEDAERARTWRPDLVPHLMQWLNSIPPQSLKYLEKISVSDLGGFEATFCYRNRHVRFGFEHPRSMVIAAPDATAKDSRLLWWASEILPFEQSQLEVAAS